MLISTCVNQYAFYFCMFVASLDSGDWHVLNCLFTEVFGRVLLPFINTCVKKSFAVHPSLLV